MRIVLVGLGAAMALVAVALPAGGAEAKLARDYIVRHDARLCPSPLCGGYWVALANRARTRCHDRLYRPRCYVASAWPASRTIEEGALVRGGIAVQQHAGFGPLGILIAIEVRNPRGAAPAGSFYRLRDIGVRCIREPCFSIRATRLNSPDTTTVSALDLSRAKLALDENEQAMLALHVDGLFAAGRVVSTDDGGRVLRASRIYLRRAKPRT